MENVIGQMANGSCGLSSLFASSEDSQKDWWDNLSVKDKINIEQGFREVKKGQVISSKDFWEKFRNSRM